MNKNYPTNAQVSGPRNALNPNEIQYPETPRCTHGFHLIQIIDLIEHLIIFKIMVTKNLTSFPKNDLLIIMMTTLIIILPPPFNQSSENSETQIDSLPYNRKP